MNNYKVTFPVALVCCLLVGNAEAADSLAQKVNLHFQATYIYQYKPAFGAAYTGPNSLVTSEEKQNSLTATLYLGFRLWKNAYCYINPEVAGGSGLSSAFGMAASTNGETFRVGSPAPTLYLARGYFRQLFPLASAGDPDADDANQLAGKAFNRYLEVLAGKFSLGDVFDNNEYANSPRTQFMNWALMNNAAWDYAANTRGYTDALVISYKSNSSMLRVGLAALPKAANGNDLNLEIGKSRSINVEYMHSIEVGQLTGHWRLLAFLNQTHMGSYTDALSIRDSNGRPDVILAEKEGATKIGVCLNADQQMNSFLGAFLRLGWNDGRNETWAFTEADETVAAGLVASGEKWRRKHDKAGVAFVVNGLSENHRNYLAQGGLGFQLGDGQLNYAPETVAELYYNMFASKKGIYLTGDYQFALHPGYNKSRGPVSVFSLRAHVQI